MTKKNKLPGKTRFPGIGGRNKPKNNKPLPKELMKHTKINTIMNPGFVSW